MKNIIYKLTFSVLVMIFLFSCETRDEAESFSISAGGDGEIPVLTVTVGESSFFDLTDLSTAKVDLNLAVVGNASSVMVYKTFNDPDLDPILVTEVNNFPATLEISVNEAIDGTDVSLEDLRPADRFYFTFIINANGLEVSPNGSAVSVATACPSSIDGMYSSTASGVLGDGSGGAADSYSDLNATIELSTTDNEGVYQINDMSFGLYPQLYEDTAPSGRASDICNDLSGLGDTDQYGDPFTINGTVNSNGTINLEWSNTWGDGGTVVLTPIN